MDLLLVLRLQEPNLVPQDIVVHRVSVYPILVLPVRSVRLLLQQDKVLPGVHPVFQEEPDHIPIPGGGIPAYPEEMHL